MKVAELVQTLKSTAEEYREGGQDLPGFEDCKWGKLVLMLEEAAKAVEALQTYDRHMQDMQDVIDRLDKEISGLTEERDRVRRELCIRIAQEPEAFAISRKWDCFKKEVGR
jgi:predicted RNase H-like nuclease (RuvC/YqgF family)